MMGVRVLLWLPPSPLPSPPRPPPPHPPPQVLVILQAGDGDGDGDSPASLGMHHQGPGSPGDAAGLSGPAVGSAQSIGVSPDK